MGKRDYAVPAAVVSGILVYLLTKYPENGGLYILAKAVVVPASVVMLLVVAALFAPGGGWAKRIFAVVFVALAAYSSFLALRDTVIAPRQPPPGAGRFQSTVAGQKVLALTSDRFTDYGLRTAEVSSPAFNSEIRVPSSGDQEPAAADRLRLGPRERPQPVPLRGHHQRDLPEPGAAGLDPGRSRPPPTGSGSGPARRRRSRTSTRRPGPAGSSAATGRSWRRSSARAAARRSPGSHGR